MTSDPRDITARRLMGLLTPEDASLFDATAAGDPAMESARQELEHAATLIAVASAPASAPSPETWQRIKAACGLSPATARRPARIIAWSGWGVAAALAVILASKAGYFSPPRHPGTSDGGGGISVTTPRLDGSPVRPGNPDPATDPDAIAEHPRADDKTQLHEVTPGTDGHPEPSEKRRLIQELATLRTVLSKFRDRDRQIFSAVPGRTWPVIIEMLPPGSSPAATATTDQSPSLAARVGQALAGIDPQEPTPDTIDPAATVDPAATHDPAKPDEILPGKDSRPRAIPVYDPARDSGTLAIHDLPPATEGFEYNLWVNPGGNSQPVLAGTLPADLRSSDALDFSLGTTGILPASYQLTLDPSGAPVPPASGNIVLQGP